MPFVHNSSTDFLVSIYICSYMFLYFVVSEFPFTFMTFLCGFIYHSVCWLFLLLLFFFFLHLFIFHIRLFSASVFSIHFIYTYSFLVISYLISLLLLFLLLQFKLKHLPRLTANSFFRLKLSLNLGVPPRFQFVSNSLLLLFVVVVV